MVLLIGNYEPDQQQSMQRFSKMMLEGLTAAGVSAELVRPEPFLGNFRAGGAFLAKWLGYVDKFLIFPAKLRALITKRQPTIAHICDHSNAVYLRAARAVPVVVTCHDLLAVRGGLGEETDCPPSATGSFLQRWILRSLRRVNAVVCVSRATLADAERLLPAGPQLSVATLGLNYPYRKLSAGEADLRLRQVPELISGKPFVLHVGSNLPRKNRAGVLRIFARARTQSSAHLVFAGDPLSAELHSLGQELRIADRIIEVVRPESPLLEALYSRATALLFPSRFEGFGWPIAEAQACGCPVVCSDRGPLPDIAGDAGLVHAVEDEAGFAADLLRLTEPAEREQWSEKSLQNAQRFSVEQMIAQYLEVYRALAPQL